MREERAVETVRLLPTWRTVIFGSLIEVDLGQAATLRFLWRRREKIVDMQLGATGFGGALLSHRFQRGERLVPAESLAHQATVVRAGDGPHGFLIRRSVIAALIE